MKRTTDHALREHLSELLEGKSAHIDLASVLDGFPVDEINVRVGGSPHTGWELLEHMRIAQWDILEFTTNSKHESPPWPDGYWPAEDGTSETWRASSEQTLAALDELRRLASDESVDLFAPIEHGDGQTVLREILLAADHSAYHLGQLMLVRKMLEHK